MRAWKLWSVAQWNARHVYPSHGVINPCGHALVGRGCHESSGQAPTLKGELRRFYKLVHPDLFHNQPVQQATNEKSFQLLQEYLNAAKVGEGYKRHVYHFEFYIRGKTSGESLEKVEISLPAPQVRSKSHSDQNILPTTRRAIGQLFAACGLSGDLAAGDERVSLPFLFQEASELQRQGEASQLNLQQQISLISNALFIGRGVRYLFRAPVEDADLALQFQLLDRMVKSLDGCTGRNFSGSTFVFGNSYKVDVRGRFWLNWEDDVKLWTQFMHQADLVTASSRRAAAKALLVQEENVAALMGVAMIFTDDLLAGNPTHLLFLRRLEEGAAEKGAIGGGRFSELPVRVGDVKDFSVDETIGCVTVPVTEDFASVNKFIEQRGVEALGHRRKMKHRENNLDNLRKHVRLKLRLRHLTFDKRLSRDQLTSACTRLSNHAPQLTAYSEGLSLCISDEYRLPSEGSGHALQMKWDFSLNDL